MKYLFTTLLIVLLSNLSFGTDTDIIVRAKAKDAKFIGSSIGGAFVIIKEKLTGEILAKGKTEGSTGNTNLIMNTPKERYSSISEESTAKFMATIDIDEPIFVTIEVYAPENKKMARVNASTELWLIPGKHILGDGVVVEIPGFVVDILGPRTHQYIPLESVRNEPLKLQANIVMMCGCPISEGGLWDSEPMEVKAIVKIDGKTVNEISLKNVSTNLFEADMNINSSGQYELIVYAYDSRTGNTGVDKVNYVITD